MNHDDNNKHNYITPVWGNGEKAPPLWGAPNPNQCPEDFLIYQMGRSFITNLWNIVAAESEFTWGVPKQEKPKPWGIPANSSMDAGKPPMFIKQGDNDKMGEN